ncbi:hypothetical protein JYQ62_11540 [Nostoc sp. UHCC 0702]|nr:hypothetical protein JYQ62_11540 [Nostoc sp. UHCC 0702]
MVNQGYTKSELLVAEILYQPSLVSINAIYINHANYDLINNSTIATVLSTEQISGIIL